MILGRFYNELSRLPGLISSCLRWEQLDNTPLVTLSPFSASLFHFPARTPWDHSLNELLALKSFILKPFLGESKLRHSLTDSFKQVQHRPNEVQGHTSVQSRPSRHPAQVQANFCLLELFGLACPGSPGLSPKLPQSLLSFGLGNLTSEAGRPQMGRAQDSVKGKCGPPL